MYFIQFLGFSLALINLSVMLHPASGLAGFFPIGKKPWFFPGYFRYGRNTFLPYYWEEMEETQKPGFCQIFSV